MRIWHTQLIEYLPDLQLVAQWRELSAMFNPKTQHKLTDFHKDYNLLHEYNYCKLVFAEFKRRGFKIYSYKKFFEYFGIQSFEEGDKKYPLLPKETIYMAKMNWQYLRECLLNLEEKACVGLIKPAEWERLWDKFGLEFNLWKEGRIPTAEKQETKPTWTHSFSEEKHEVAEEPKEEPVAEKPKEEYIPLRHERCDSCYYMDEVGFRCICTNQNSGNCGKVVKGSTGCKDWHSYNEAP